MNQAKSTTPNKALQSVAKPQAKQRQKAPKIHYRTIFISDVHLGFKGCQANFLLDFLKRYHCDTLYLVGDIIDGWQLKEKVFWPQSHTNVIRRILTLSKRGTKVVFVTGNHDEFLRKYSGVSFGNIHLVDEATHITADKRRLMVVHGDQFDAVTRYHGWVSHLGSNAYDALISVNTHFNRLRARFGMGYWSLSSFIKQRVKTAVSFIAEFEQWLARSAKQNGYDGVVCGHIHHAEIRNIDGIEYFNCGDWVESCTALVEDESGKIKIIRWLDEQDGITDFAGYLDKTQKEFDPVALISELNSLSAMKKRQIAATANLKQVARPKNSNKQKEKL